MSGPNPSTSKWKIFGAVAMVVGCAVALWYFVFRSSHLETITQLTSPPSDRTFLTGRPYVFSYDGDCATADWLVSITGPNGPFTHLASVAGTNRTYTYTPPHSLFLDQQLVLRVQLPNDGGSVQTSPAFSVTPTWSWVTGSEPSTTLYIPNLYLPLTFASFSPWVTSGNLVLSWSATATGPWVILSRSSYTVTGNQVVLNATADVWPTSERYLRLSTTNVVTTKFGPRELHCITPYPLSFVSRASVGNTGVGRFQQLSMQGMEGQVRFFHPGDRVQLDLQVDDTSGAIQLKWEYQRSDQASSVWQSLSITPDASISASTRSGVYYWVVPSTFWQNNTYRYKIRVSQAAVETVEDSVESVAFAVTKGLYLPPNAISVTCRQVQSTVYINQPFTHFRWVCEGLLNGDPVRLELPQSSAAPYGNRYILYFGERVTSQSCV